MPPESREQLLNDLDSETRELTDLVNELVELATDRQERPIIEAIGDDLPELLELLAPMVDAILAGKGYPGDPRTRTRPCVRAGCDAFRPGHRTAGRGAPAHAEAVPQLRPRRVCRRGAGTQDRP